MGEGYDGGRSVGGRWGCAVATIIGLPIFAFLLIGDALGDCIPDAECHKGFWQFVVLPTAIVMAIVGFGVRFIVNAIARRKDGGSD